MTKPEMIIFDYGNTLLYEPDRNSERCNRELMKYITRNPNNQNDETEIDFEYLHIHDWREMIEILEGMECSITRLL